MAWPVVSVASGGIPVTIAESGTPVTQVLSNGTPVVFVSAGGMPVVPEYDVDAAAWFAAMPTQPNATVKSILNTFVSGLKTDSLWSLIDGGNFLCLETLDQGLVDFKSPARVATTAPGFTSTFTAYRGVMGSGSASGSQNAYIDTGFIPSSAGGVFTLNSMHLGVSIGNNVGVTVYDIGSSQNPNFTLLNTRSGSSNLAGYFNNNSLENVSATSSITTSVGHSIITRTGVNTNKGYKNGVDAGGSASAASVALPSNSIRYLQVSNLTATTRQIQMAHYGGGLDATQAAALNTRVQTAIAALTVL